MYPQRIHGRLCFLVVGLPSKSSVLADTGSSERVSVSEGQLGEEGSGTFALSCTFVNSAAGWDLPGSLSLWSPTPQHVRRRLIPSAQYRHLQPQEGGNTKAISTPSLLLCDCVYSLGSDDRDRIELWMTAGLRAVSLSAREGGHTPACWFCLEKPGLDAVQNLYL